MQGGSLLALPRCAVPTVRFQALKRPLMAQGTRLALADVLRVLGDPKVVPLVRSHTVLTGEYAALFLLHLTTAALAPASGLVRTACQRASGLANGTRQACLVPPDTLV